MYKKKTTDRIVKLRPVLMADGVGSVVVMNNHVVVRTTNRPPGFLFQG